VSTARVIDDDAPRAIDVDADLLRRSADAVVHAAEQARVHMEAEEACLTPSGVPELLETLTPNGPWAWAIMPEIRDDGSVKVPIATTRDAIADWYAVVRGRSNVKGFDPLVEVRGAWYTFQEGVSKGRSVATGISSETETIALLPVGSERGITGELVWWRMPLTGETGDDPGARATALRRRRDARERHDAYLQAWAAGDADALAAVFTERAQSAVRDYVDDTATLTGLDGRGAHAAHHRRFFERFVVERVDLLERVVQEWYVFAEVRVTVRWRSGPYEGASLAANLAEFLIPGADGAFVARIGHGTDLVALDGTPS
jgi:hypothetical protein